MKSLYLPDRSPNALDDHGLEGGLIEETSLQDQTESSCSGVNPNSVIAQSFQASIGMAIMKCKNLGKYPGKNMNADSN
jgi:hypothetical protein